MQVKFYQGDAVIIGEVWGIAPNAVVVVEAYASSIWGESYACTGLLHSITPASIVELNDPSCNS